MLILISQPTYTDIDFQRIEFINLVPDSYHKIFYKIFDFYPNIKIKIKKCNAFKKCYGGNIINHYLVETEENEKYILKIKKKFDAWNVGLIEKLLDYLSCKGVNALYPEKNYMNKYYTYYRSDPEYIIELSKFIQGEYYNNALNQLGAIAEKVADLHYILRSCPQAKEVKKNTDKIDKSIHDGFKQIARGELNNYNKKLQQWFQANKSYVERLISDYKPINSINNQMQIIHGDLNRGNTLISANPFKILFFDFENTVYSYFPIISEISYIIQRYILFDSPSQKALFERLDVFLSKYNKIYPINFNSLEMISYILRLFSYRKTIIVFLTAIVSGIFNEKEMNKFVFLEQQAFAYEKTMLMYFK